MPSLGLEADLHQRAPSTLKLDIDPRLVVSANPSQLPPIPADWYRSLTDADRQQTLDSAVRFISGNLVFKSGAEPVMLKWRFTAVDGTTAVPLNDDSKEVHLLAQATVTLSGSDFTVSLGRDCAAALTMIAAVDGKTERRSQVLFPGETSRPVKIIRNLAEPKIEAPSSLPQPSQAKLQGQVAVTSDTPTGPWYWEPFKLGLTHFLHREDFEYSYDVPGVGFVLFEGGWSLSHLVFAIVLAVLVRSIPRALRAILMFHALHFVFTLLFAVTGTVLPMPEFVWPTCVIVLGLLVWKVPNLAIPCLIAAALIHNLDEWPHAAGFTVLTMIELGFLASGIVIQLLVTAFVCWMVKIRSGK
ncbi:MAG: hypothetical protein JNJ83_18725 [Verrucomicrobiaceae bacterium]|nr:hypothetical protein [Verrucomicrobiaceae bacterium]